MSIVTSLFLVLVIIILGLKLYLNRRQIAAISNHYNQVPAQFAATISMEQHQKAANYNISKLKVDNFQEIYATILLLAFTLGGGINLINNLFPNLVSSPLSYGVMVIAAFTLVNAALNLPFSLYDTFKVEQKYGFNNTTVKLFILDLIKSTCLMLIIGIPLLYLILYLITIMGSWWWLWVWIVFVVFNLTIMIIYPLFIAPLFNKFTPLDDDNLKNRITKLLDRCGFKAKGVFVMDGSRRSSHGNAYFTGIGKSKRIVFFDTLIKNLEVDEIEAVLAHELGHFKKKHILRKIIIAFIINLIVLYVLSLLITQPVFYSSLGVDNVNIHNGLILFTILIGLFSTPLKPLSAYFSRKDEFEADKFAAEYKDKTYLISGLVKLYRDNAATLTPDSVYATFYYSHPPATIRIEHLERQ